MAARPDDAILSLPLDERLALVDSILESTRGDAHTVPVDEETTPRFGDGSRSTDTILGLRTISTSSWLDFGRTIGAPRWAHH